MHVFETQSCCYNTVYVYNNAHSTLSKHFVSPDAQILCIDFETSIFWLVTIKLKFALLNVKYSDQSFFCDHEKFRSYVFGKL